MHLKKSTWFWLSVLCLSALVLWRGPEKPHEQTVPGRAALPRRQDRSPFATAIANNGSAISMSPAARAAQLRLKNTPLPLQELIKSDRAILLRNAFIDTASPLPEIPAGFKSNGDPGSYLVQARGVITPAFKARLAKAGATTVAYMPNNAFLVRGDVRTVARLEGQPEVQAVIPFEPYYKLDSRLLSLAVNGEAMPEGAALRLTLFPGESDSAKKELTRLGLTVLGEEGSPFGPQLLVSSTGARLADIASLRQIQTIEPHAQRAMANERTRLQLGVSTDVTNSPNYLNLTGSNVWVNVNDGAVDKEHPDLIGRVSTDPDTPGATFDVSGHGTHVAATIAGTGSASGGLYQGMAPGADIFVLPIDYSPNTSAHVTDTFLQETAASSNLLVFRGTNATLISNNSWYYTGANEYDTAAARYDAAARDALPRTTNSQSVLYVFAAGNSGFGGDDGQGGEPGTIFSPATAKNVLTIGALEHLRNITNAITVITTNGTGTNMDITTNHFPIFLNASDTENEVASYSSRGNVGIGLESDFGRFKPDLVAPGSFIISAKSPHYKFQTNSDPEITRIMKEWDSSLTTNGAAGYMYQSGTTFAAPAVSGLAALMQEFFEQKIAPAYRHSPSPALLKALLINGARSVNPIYDLQVNATINLQGWGLPNIRNSIPEALVGPKDDEWPLRFFEQSATNALATGQSRSWDLTLNTNVQGSSLRVTLVWTDPPGNPTAGLKLVNDLDLVVTNLDSGFVYYGNNIPQGSDFNQASDPTNEPPVLDVVNNVENVFIRDPLGLGPKWSIGVTAKRVNVNAVPDFYKTSGDTNDVVQDFALVISAGDVTLTNAFKLAPGTSTILTNLVSPPRTIVNLTNALPVFGARAGANASLQVTNGVTNQWSFFVFTNTAGLSINDDYSITNGTNVAFVTFFPANLSNPRNVEADIDLYVSTNPQITNLTPNVLATAFKSVSRGGTETIVLTNALLDETFYIAVKSEDQQASEFGLILISTDEPFETTDKFGHPVLKVFPGRRVLPDGSPSKPSGAIGIAIGITPGLVQRAISTATIFHENFGDIVGSISHAGRQSIFLNHFLSGGPTDVFFGTNSFTFNDSGSPMAGYPSSRPSEGPGDLNQFNLQSSQGAWIFQLTDNAPTHVGRLIDAAIIYEPLVGGLLRRGLFAGTVGIDEPVCYALDVPQNATNLILTLSSAAIGDLDLVIKKDQSPSQTVFDAKGRLKSGQVLLTLNATNTPPLTPGRYIVCVYNNSLANVAYQLRVDFEFDLSLDLAGNFFSSSSVPLLDDGLVESTFEVTADRLVENARVGVRIDHPRVSDLALSLVSPQGTRILLAENRGGTSTNGYGAGSATNLSLANFTEDTTRTVIPIKFATPPFGPTNASPVPVFLNGFEKIAAGGFPVGAVRDGWTATGNDAEIVSALGFAPERTRFAALCGGGLTATFNTIAGKEYLVRFTSRAPAGLFGTGVGSLQQRLASASMDPHWIVESFNSNIVSPLYVVNPKSRPATWNDSNLASWISISRTGFGFQNEPADFYTYRTLFSMCGYDASTAKITGRWATDDKGVTATLNGKLIPGALAVNPSSPGALNIDASYFLPGVNTLEFVTTNSAGPIGFFAELNLARTNLASTAASSPGGQFVVNGGTNQIAGSDGWRTNLIVFVAQTNQATISIAATAAGLWVDDFDIHENGNRYYLPEESLDILKGEKATGTWTLQVRDTRTGPDPTNTPPPALIAWNLDLDFAIPSASSIILTNGTAYTNSLKQFETRYFIVDTCPLTSSATIVLSGPRDGLELLMDRDGFPTGNRETDDFEPIVNTATNGIARVTLTSSNPAPAPLVPGERFFLAVRNVNTLLTNNFSLSVTLDNADCLVTSTNTSSTPSLPSAVALAASLGGQEVAIYTFDIPGGDAAALFELYNLSGNADLFLRRGSPPTGSAYDRVSANPGLTPEQIVLRNIGESPDISGQWYVSVVNEEDHPVAYTLRAVSASPGTILISAQPLHVVASLNTGGAFQITWSSIAGEKYRVETSADLKSWQSLTTVTAAGAASTFTDSSPARSQKQRFYRIVQSP